MKKTILAVLCCMLVAFGFSSCDKVTIQSAYGIGIHSFKASGDDFYNFCLYLTEKGVPYAGDESILIFEGKNKAECDAQAVAFFEKQVAKLSYEEVEAFLEFPASFYVEYSLVGSTKSPDEESPVLGIWTYPPTNK